MFIRILNGENRRPSAASSSFAQSRAIKNDDPFRYCVPTTVDSSDEQKLYWEGWRAFRKGW
jgi:hypothetical protein